MSNQGSQGTGIFKQLSGYEFQLYKLASANNLLICMKTHTQSTFTSGYILAIPQIALYLMVLKYWKEIHVVRVIVVSNLKKAGKKV